MIRRADGRFARTPRPPYYAVVFTSLRSRADDDGYGRMADRMMRLARRQDGFLGAESVRGADGLGITVSYWRSAAAIRRWRDLAEHRAAQTLGYARWYDAFELRVARVTRAYAFRRGPGLRHSEGHDVPSREARAGGPAGGGVSPSGAERRGLRPRRDSGPRHGRRGPD